MTFQAGEFVWVSRVVGWHHPTSRHDVGIFLCDTGLKTARILVAYSGRPMEIEVSLDQLEAATATSFTKKKQLREALAVQAEYTRVQLEAIKATLLAGRAA